MSKLGDKPFNPFSVPQGEIVIELCEVMDRQHRTSLEIINGGFDIGKAERLGRLATRAAQLKQKILGDPWLGVGQDKNGNWVLIDPRAPTEAK